MPAVESWDDDGDLEGDLFAHSASTAHSKLSSRVSARSESNFGEEDWQVQITPNDQTSTSMAISSAKQVGIPIPQNIPSSALLGGTITRLGKKKSRQHVADDWGDDFDAPDLSAGLKLRAGLNSDGPAPTTPATDQEEFDSEWAEGSLGIRFGGTRRETRNRSSSVSAMSPSLGSCMTIESEDDDLGGLVLPNEPIDFTSLLKKRKEAEHDRDTPTSAPAIKPQLEPAKEQPAPTRKPSFAPTDEDDMMTGLDFGGGDFLDSRKHNINRNVRVNQQKTATPATRAPATTITFVDKPGNSRIPRPATGAKNYKLDPVPESGSSHPTTQLNRVSRPTATTTSAQLLRSKRSAPVLGSRPSGSRQSGPFLPSGPHTGQSHHVSTKSVPFHHRKSSGHERPLSPTTRSFSRMGSLPPTTDSTPSRTGFRKEATAASLLRQAANQRTLNIPKRRAFGDGSELERFDDLPTSATKESKFTKEPANRGTAKTLRHLPSRRKLTLTEPSTTPLPPSIPSSATSTLPSPLAPPTPRGYMGRVDNTPRFARDTAASRNAREQRLGTVNSRPRGSGPIEPVSINWKAQVAARSPQTSPSSQRNKNRGDVKKPMLIKHIGTNASKNEKGMVYNPSLQRWEGNEHALTKFDNPSTSTLPLHPTHKDNHSHHHHTNSIPNVLALSPRDHNSGPPRHGSPPRPALISNVNATRGIVVERGMVFDPQRMTWLKLDSRTVANDPFLIGSGIGTASISAEEEEDPFAGMEDLVDEKTAKVQPGVGGIKSVDKENENWAVGEEFDLGPAFVRRQRAEEAEWRRRVEKWMTGREAIGDEWRWEIRRVAESYEGIR